MQTIRTRATLDRSDIIVGDGLVRCQVHAFRQEERHPVNEFANALISMVIIDHASEIARTIAETAEEEIGHYLSILFEHICDERRIVLQRDNILRFKAMGCEPLVYTIRLGMEKGN